MIQWLKNNFITRRRYSLALYGIAALYVFSFYFAGHHYNNFLIYTGSFRHLIHQTGLYHAYPGQYEDYFLYGPVFAALIAPFAIVPFPAGLLCWLLFVAGVFFIAIQSLPFSRTRNNLICLICLNELLLSQQYTQVNPLIAALIILSFVFIEKEKDGWAALMVALGFWIKLYGIIALAFVLFSKHKTKFIGSFLLWSGVCFVLPMLLSSPGFVLHAYGDWIHRLIDKNALNQHIAGFNLQNISLEGILQRVFGLQNLNDGLVVIPAAIAIGLSFLKVTLKQGSAQLSEKLLLLSLSLISIVIFSTSAESCTYIIAFAGFGIWVMLRPYPFRGTDLYLFLFVLIFASVIDSDLITRDFKNNISVRYALKAIPLVLLWCHTLYRMWFKTEKKFLGYPLIT